MIFKEISVYHTIIIQFEIKQCSVKFLFPVPFPFRYFATGLWRRAYKSKLCLKLAVVDKIHQHISLRYRGNTSYFITLVL